MSWTDIVFAVDEKNFDQVAVVIESIRASAARPDTFRYHIVFDGDAAVAEDRIARWPDLPQHLALVPVSNRFTDRQPIGHIPATAMLKTQIPDLFPQLRRAIYLDADIIVQRDLAELFSVDLGGAAAGGVVDMGIYLEMRRGALHRDYKWRDYLASLGLDPRAPSYVNSGVLLMDLDALRAADFTRRVAVLSAERGRDLLTMEQCAISAVLLGRLALLDARWNVLANVVSLTRRLHYIPRKLQHDLARQLSEQWIIHYAGLEKPWNTASVWGGDIWWRHADRTGIKFARPGPRVVRRRSGLEAAWLGVTHGLSKALSRYSPD